MKVLVLDTNAIIRLEANRLGEFRPEVLNAIEDADRLIIPALASLELQYLETRKKVVQSAARVMQTMLVELRAQMSDAEAWRLSEIAADLRWTMDPFDRLICADAIYHDATLITSDRLILSNLPNALW